MKAIDIARDSLKRHEGFRAKVYRCTAGKNTVAYGRNLDDKGITLEEAEMLLDNDIDECVQDLATFSWWSSLDSQRQAALIDMRFNLGPTRFRSFKMMIQALEIRDYTDAASQVMNSNYAQQVGRRAEWIAESLSAGMAEPQVHRPGAAQDLRGGA
jgi:lysozyme